MPRTVRRSFDVIGARRAAAKAADRRRNFALAILAVCGVVLFMLCAVAGNAPGLTIPERDVFAFGALLGFMVTTVAAIAAALSRR